MPLKPLQKGDYIIIDSFDHQKNLRSLIIRKLVIQTALGISLILLILGISRFIMLFNFGNASVLTGHSNDLIRMFFRGLRFDLRVATIAHAPFLLLGFLLLPWTSLAQSYIKKLHYVAALLGLAAFVAAVFNYYYYATYGSYFNLFIFGLVEEETHSVLINIWDDYPILRFIASTFFLGFIFERTMKWLWNRLDKQSWQPWSKISTTIFTVIIILCYAISTRGSVGTFPLRRDDAQVSNLQLINMVTPNAVVALSWAISDYAKDSRYPIADDNEGQKLFSKFLGHSIPKSEVSLQQFADRTPKNLYLEQHPPHVVFAVMESLSNHLLTYDAPPRRDLLGAWRKYWQSDYTFRRFVSDGNGTMDSLARLLVSSPVKNIGQSRAQRTPFESNLVRPYKVKGYRTIFITSGNGSWCNLSSFLKHLGFDEVVEQNDLVNRYSEAKLGTWGTFDEFSFRYAEERLEEADKKGEKLFIMILSITNHPPYKVPSTFKQPPHELDESIRQRLSALSSNIDLMIATFQYANDSIGRFIQQLEKKGIGDHTMIAVTGDHNMRVIGYSDPKECVLQYSVPFFLHVPHKYQQQLPGLVYDPNRVGSHKDIMPTLYALSLSDTPYYRRGVNLLAKNVSSPWYFAYNEAIGLSEEGAYLLTGQPAFYPWRDGTGLMVLAGANLDSKHRTELDRIMSYKSLLRWQLNRQVNRQP